MSAKKRRKSQGIRRELRRPRGWMRWFRDGPAGRGPERRGPASHHVVGYALIAFGIHSEGWVSGAWLTHGFHTNRIRGQSRGQRQEP